MSDDYEAAEELGPKALLTAIETAMHAQYKKGYSDALLEAALDLKQGPDLGADVVADWLLKRRGKLQ